MIPFLILMLLFLAPGNDLIYALLLMFCVPKFRIQLCLPQQLFISWLAWSVLSCAISTRPFEAFMGSMFRMEGFVFWLIITRLAYLFWTSYGKMSGFRVPVLWMCATYVFFLLLNKNPPTQPIMASGFGSMAFSILAIPSPYYALIPLAVAIYAGTRTTILVVLMVSFFLIFTRAKRNIMVAVGVTMACLAMIFMMIDSPNDGSIASSVLTKCKKVDVGSFGKGARTFWIQQTYDIVNGWPIWKKILGDGFDTMSHHLKNPDDGMVCPVGVPDRTHNIVCDLLLQTGIMGLGLALACFASCIWLVYKMPITRNRMCFLGICSWIIFGMFNPQGCTAHALMVICVFGMMDKR